MIVYAIFIIGHLTHADYYTKLRKEDKNVMWGIGGWFGSMYVLLSLIGIFALPLKDAFDPSNGAVLILCFFVYFLFIAIAFHNGYMSLYNYFGKKRKLNDTTGDSK